MSGKIIAFVGPSGVGKNFVKQAVKSRFPQLKELTVYTTRKKRSCDGLDRESVTAEQFSEMQQKGELVGSHQPFGPGGDWYGFSKQQIDKMIEDGQIIMTEIHADNAMLFKELYGDKIFMVVLTANKDYLEHNLKSRDSEKDAEQEDRLNKAITEIEAIQLMRNDGLISKNIQVDWNNREKIAEIVTDELSKEIEPYINNENESEFKN